jgi:hypothetical protein
MQRVAPMSRQAIKAASAFGTQGQNCAPAGRLDARAAGAEEGDGCGTCVNITWRE